jgi:DNA polymerase-3 subunit epsilon
MNFLAIDFETANYYRNSACAVGLVKVNDNQIVKRTSFLIKPPQKWFVFTYLHGVSWENVKNEPGFNVVWANLTEYFEGIDFIVAHNASFDRSVIKKCCEYYGIEIPQIPFVCTVHISRLLWNIYPTNLANVCRHFNIPLKHHDALSDTEACAEIMIRAIKDGYIIRKK